MLPTAITNLAGAVKPWGELNEFATAKIRQAILLRLRNRVRLFARQEWKSGQSGGGRHCRCRAGW
jgi:hypothetical protein